MERVDGRHGQLPLGDLLEGLLANVVSERTNISGYGKGEVRKYGWLGSERARWKRLFPKLTDEQLKFFKIHNEADEIHSDLGWGTSSPNPPAGSGWRTGSWNWPTRTCASGKST